MPRDFDLLNQLFGSGVYTEPARLRADDLLVRSRAQQPLERAVALLRDVAVRYQHDIVPPASRSQPFPDPATVAPMRRADQERVALSECLDALRGLTAPASDHVWNRHRQPTPLLDLLVATDRLLIYQCDHLLETLQSLTITTLATFDWTPFEAALAELRQALESRRQLTRLDP
ncbi:MAG: hypothetical protein M1118_01845 [Chloroflexi bacterium]|nr:hypothetical protein [Chloroflexota bacterium]